MSIEKLKKIQSELKAPKNQFNSFGKYNYRSCEDILEAVKPLLNVNGFILTMTDEVLNIGNYNYVKATVNISGENFDHKVSAFAREPKEQKGMSDSQITGAASSYARKYALNGMFCIDDTKDADSMKPEEKKDEHKDDKVWLNPGTDKWTEAIKYLNGGGVMAEIEKKYKISKVNKQKLQDESI